MIEARHIIRMPLQPPKRTPEGFYLGVDPYISTPSIRWNGVWECNTEMVAWLSEQRMLLMNDLLSHGNWFSRPPRRETLDTLFAPWYSISGEAVEATFICPTPTLSDASPKKAIWKLDGILMSAKAITPVWSILSIQDEVPDTITLFDDSEDGQSREIQFHEIETVLQSDSAPTKLRGREWEARKFIGKERVREARLKAQISKRIAKKEESRYYQQFGVPDDGESRMSDFDLTDSESGSDSSSHSSEFETEFIK